MRMSHTCSSQYFVPTLRKTRPPFLDHFRNAIPTKIRMASSAKCAGRDPAWALRNAFTISGRTSANAPRQRKYVAVSTTMVNANVSYMFKSVFRTHSSQNSPAIPRSLPEREPNENTNGQLRKMRRPRSGVGSEKRLHYFGTNKRQCSKAEKVRCRKHDDGQCECLIHVQVSISYPLFAKLARHSSITSGSRAQRKYEWPAPQNAQAEIRRGL